MSDKPLCPEYNWVVATSMSMAKKIADALDMPNQVRDMSLFPTEMPVDAEVRFQHLKDYTEKHGRVTLLTVVTTMGVDCLAAASAQLLGKRTEFFSKITAFEAAGVNDSFYLTRNRRYSPGPHSVNKKEHLIG
jgi:hypothetical protein